MGNKLMFAVLVVLMHLELSAQQVANSTNSSDQSNVYYQALRAFFRAEYGTETGRTLIPLYIERDSSITHNLLSSSEHFHIIQQSHDQLLDRALSDTNASFIKLYPLEYVDGKFGVPVKQFRTVIDEATGSIQQVILSSVLVRFKFHRGEFVVKGVGLRLNDLH